MTNEKTVRVACPRCDGKGKIWWSSVKGSVCFKCNGSGYEIMTERAYRARQRRQAKAAERKAAEQAERDERIREANARLDALVDTYRQDPRIDPRTLELEAEGHPDRLYEAVKYLDRVDRGEVLWYGRLV